ncbi:MAG: tRNA preQ1(34) S-adenosylmethionine ribosyltransferase-isomerase QueA [Candidatus Loosdrechtia sp.]|uniref:S-adenosylmethionine:tRNA ribosyltransferase-isomerase n=1 Tax=Candidatus Loosdrechtia sp. TaxID=3101272 RepID=UPI003A78CE6F|nr:MAG: tRNA preQ1(34) S-adenosylmethionine ribosyltransferase-isomerase QueA [Candidatus Jettenia sp. AMX2]
MNINPFKTTEIFTKLSDFDFELPRELIAQQPLKNREDARMLILNRSAGRIEHRKFYEMPDYLFPGDLLILNNTRVTPARVVGNKSSGAFVEILFIEELEGNRWKVLMKSNAKLRKMDEIGIYNNTIFARLTEKLQDGSWHIEFQQKNNIRELLGRIGEMPLPPYIKRSKSKNQLCPLDKERYQTVFAQKEGAIAAPTAGLHFSQEILESIKKQGVEVEFITLHIGPGTFLPIKAENVLDHFMHKEYYECSEEVFRKIKKTRERNNRIIATGSTSCRTLETIALNDKAPKLSGWTNLFIHPPYNFKYTDVLLTNFHLPRTTLLLLVSAFAGRDAILHAYETAKNEGYRFFSYGDCMMII